MKKNDFAGVVMTFVSVLLLGSVFLLPRRMEEKLLYMAACVAMPEGGMAQVQNAIYNEKTILSPSVTTTTSVKAGSLTNLQDTPADILQWIADAKKDEPHQKKDGDIREQTYTEKSATEKFRNLLIRNVTEDVHPDYEKYWKENANLTIDKSKPAVLLYHTHTTEGYETLDRVWYAADVNSRTTDENRNVVRVGTAIAGELERAGFQVIHDTTIHDEKYNGAYDRSRATVEKYLAQYPDLSVTLDVHRDAIQENNGVKVKPITTIDGKKAAQVMIIAGTKGGTNSAKDFDTWEDNFRFALRLQDACEASSPTLMRPIFFCYRRYNMHLTPCSLLVEFGSEANTLQEAEYAGRLFGRALANLLEDYVK